MFMTEVSHFKTLHEGTILSEEDVECGSFWLVGDKEPNIQITQSLCTSSALLPGAAQGTYKQATCELLQNSQVDGFCVENLTFSDLMENDVIWKKNSLTACLYLHVHKCS